MTGNSRSESQAALEAYDFTRFSCVVDVGGGQGLLLKEILLACPSARGVLFDQPHVIAADQVAEGRYLALAPNEWRCWDRQIRRRVIGRAKRRYLGRWLIDLQPIGCQLSAGNFDKGITLC